MKKKESSGMDSARKAIPHITIGIQLCAVILIGVFAGYRLDEHMETSPVFLVVGTAAGMIIGFYSLFRELKVLEAKKSVKEENTKKVRWM